MDKYLERGRDYLMTVRADKITVEDTLEAFGFGSNGLQIPPRAVSPQQAQLVAATAALISACEGRILVDAIRGFRDEAFCEYVKDAAKALTAANVEMEEEGKKKEL